MAQITPKIKMFIFVCFISVAINMSACMISWGMSNDINLGSFVTSGATSFLPFVDLVSLSFLNFSGDIYMLFAIITIVLGAIKLALILLAVLSALPILGANV